LVGCSPLILLNDLLVPFGIEPFGLFDVTPVGAALVLSGIGYFVLFGRFVLPKAETKGRSAAASEGDDSYDATVRALGELREARTPDDFAHYREPVTVDDLRRRFVVNVLAIREPSYPMEMNPPGNKELRGGTDVVLHGNRENLERLAEEEGLDLSDSLEVFKEALAEENAGVVEAVVAPRSTAVEKTFGELDLAERFGVTPLAVSRQDQTFVARLSEVGLRVGDAVVFHGLWRKLKTLRDEGQFIFVTPIDVEELKPEKAMLAGFWLAVALIMVIVFHIQLSVCLMTGALGMILSRVLSIDEAYRSVDWRTIFLLAGLIPLGIATEKTGTAAWVARSVLGALGGSVPELLLLTIVAVLATLFTLVISNVGATVLLVPLVVNLATAAGSDPRMAALVVGLATSNSFMLPTHQVNALYMGPGHYRSVDFMKAGGILTVIFIVVMVAMLHFFY
jgi:di/tricarboxylate transporter